ncbi:MAG: hypothetical protein S4CHLAM102_15290 [Chlamydiia bacterium]|nr:hypothetical protein [Chlamydiia bacterium]
MSQINLKFGAEGFEPPHGGTKNRCLTAWRRPSKFEQDHTLKPLFCANPFLTFSSLSIKNNSIGLISPSPISNTILLPEIYKGSILPDRKDLHQAKWEDTMCYQCWDADKKDIMNAQFGSESCEGEEMLKMSVEEMKQSLTVEWIVSGKEKFRVFKEAVTNACDEIISWTAKHPKINNGQETTLTSRLV